MTEARQEWRVFVACEGPSDFRRIPALLQAAVAERNWLLTYPKVCGEAYVKISQLRNLARKVRLSTKGGDFREAGGAHGDRHGLKLFVQLLIHERVGHGPNVVVVWARDTDGDLDREQAAYDVVGTVERFPHFLLAVAHECSEAWVLAGWKPTTASEHKALNAHAAKLGFDPTREPHRLSHKDDGPRSAKAALRALNIDVDREVAALEVAFSAATGTPGPQKPHEDATRLRRFCLGVARWRDSASDAARSSAS